MFEKKNGKRFLASVMALVMLLSLAPVGALAADGETPITEECSAMPLPANEDNPKPVVTDEENTTNTNEEPTPSNEGYVETPADNNGASTAVSEMPVIMNPVDLLNQASDYTTELTWSPSSSSIEEATFFYLKTPTSKLNSNKAKDWGPALGNGEINTDGLEWKKSDVWGSNNRRVENATNVTNSNVNSWPSTHGEYDSEKDGYVLSKNSAHWKTIFNAYKDTIKEQLSMENLQESDVEAIILTPFKVSRNNITTGETEKSYHVDCKVEVKCRTFATATFKLWDETDNEYKYHSAENYQVGSSVTFPRVPDKTGYTFSGWYLDEGLTGSALDKYTIKNNVTFYAKYTPNTYTVTFNAGENGKLDQDKSTVTKTGTSGTSLSAPATNANEGYEFAGWVEGSDTTANTVEIPTTITKNVTYTATWREKTYTVIFNAGDNGKLDQDKSTVTKTGTSGTSLSAPATNANEGYEFAGWVEGSDTTANTVEIPTTITKNVTYTATWREKTYTVIFNAGDNGKLDQDKSTVTKTGTSGTSLSAPATNANEGYEFAGWVEGSDTTANTVEIPTTITKNVTYTATWREKTYTVIFNAGDNGKLDQDKSTVTKTGTSGTSLSAPATNANEGYEFAGWVEGSDTIANTVEIPTTITKNVTYTATWREKTYTVIFNAGDNGKLDQDKSTVTKTGTSGTSLSAPATNANEGYEFAGWVEGSDTTANTVEIPATITKNVTYTATWRMEQNPSPDTVNYTINKHFKGNKGNTIKEDKGTATLGTKNATLDSLITSAAVNQIDGENKYVYVSGKTTYTVGTGENKKTENLVATATLTEDTTIDLYYYLDNWKDGSSVKEDNEKGGDGIPDCDQVLIKYVSSNSERGTVSPDMEVLTLRKDNENVQIKINGSKATDNGGRNYFSNWTDEVNNKTINDATLTADTIKKAIENAEGGETYTFTANFGYSGGGGGGSNRPKPPVVEIPDDVPTGLNGKDHYAYIIGYGNNDVRPQNNITRAEVATIFFRLLTDETREANMTKSNGYNDVKDGDWFCCAVSTLSKMGIIKGYEDGSFKPNDPISRAEFAAIAARFDPDGDKTPATFADVTSHWAKDEISIAANHGWIKGYEDGSFKPDQKITRAETMTLVNRVLNRLPETKDDLHKDMKTWVDNMDETAWYYLAVQEATNSHYFKNKTSTKFEQWTDLRDTRDWSELEK